MKKAIILLLCFLSTTLLSIAQNNNLVENGTFNTIPSYSGWRLESVDKMVANKTTGGNPGGYVWLNEVGTTDDPGVVQVLDDLKIGAEYLIEGDYRAGDHFPLQNQGKQIADILAVDIDNDQIASFELPKPWNKWVKFRVTFRATQPQHTLRLRGEIDGTDADVFLDNIKVTPASSLLSKTDE